MGGACSGSNFLDQGTSIKADQLEHFHSPGFFAGRDQQSKGELAFKSSGRKCRMARKRRSLPYQVPFPCCTSRKSVEELIAEKNLEFLLQKQLKPSDVGNLGRIVLPKKEAESSLPYLTVREGMTIVMEDLTTAYKWHMRYRFWPNNKSRMYLLENTGEFIRSHCLKEGDLLQLYKYKDCATEKYVILGKKATATEDSSTSADANNISNKKGGAGKNKRSSSTKSCKFETSSSRLVKPLSRAPENSKSGSPRSSLREGHGLANFDSFEASDIQEILTSLS